MTYDITKGSLGVLLLDARAVSLRIQKEGAHSALGLVRILINIEAKNAGQRTNNQK